jgi:Tfp pilus assembly protein PilF
MKRGVEFLEARQPEKALEVFREFLQANPKHSLSYFYLGTALDECGKIDEAVAAYREAIKLNNDMNMDSAQLRVNLGNALLQRKQVQEAIAQFKRALDISPDPRASYSLARAYLETAHPFMAVMARTQLESAAKAGFRPSQMQRLMAQALYYMGQRQQALQLLKDYQSALPDRVTAEEKTAIEVLITEITKELHHPAKPPVMESDRTYTLDRGHSYAVISTNHQKHRVTLASSGNEDPDAGKQDGKNDGIFTMDSADFHKQVEDGGNIYRPR